MDEPSLLARVWEFLVATLGYWSAWVTGVVLVIEQFLELVLPKAWWKRVDEKVPKHERRRLLLGLCAVGFVVASFQAFDDVNRRLREAQKHPALDTLNRSRLQFEGITLEKYPDLPGTSINIHVSNEGNIAVERSIALPRGRLSEHTLSEQEEVSELNAMKDALARSYGQEGTDQLQPGQHTIVTLPDITLSDSDVRDFTDNKKSVYVFFVAEYQDDKTKGIGWWKMQFCGYFIGTSRYWHRCHVASRIELDTSRR